MNFPQKKAKHYLSFQLNVKGEKQSKIASPKPPFFTTIEKLWEKNYIGIRAETDFKPDLKIKVV